MFDFKPYIGVAILLSMAACSSQSGGGSTTTTTGTATTTTTTIGNAQNATSETATFPNRTVPDIDSMTLAIAKPNLRARGWVGVSTTISVFVGDNLNDKTVLDGVTVNFAAEGGRIDPSCSITNGSCTVTWNSQSPIPSDGRVTIVAWMSGAESFKDLNANGFFDDGDLFADVADRPDLSEPFLNDNKFTFINNARPAFSYTGSLAALNNVTESTVRDATETFFDTAGFTDGVFDDKDGKYSGPSCAHSTLCSSVQSIFIWREAEIIVSGDNPTINIFSVPTDGSGDAGMTAATFPVAAPARLRVEVTDGFNNVLPADAEVIIALTNVAGTTRTGVVGNSRFPSAYFVNILSDGTSSTDGKFSVQVKIPQDASVSGFTQSAVDQTLEFTATD